MVGTSMHRKVYIKFHSKRLVTLTNFAKQRKIDLSTCTQRYIDLIDFSIKDDVDGIQFFALADEDSDGTYLHIYSRHTIDTVPVCIGYADVKKFEYMYTNKQNNHTHKSGEGVFEVTLLEP